MMGERRVMQEALFYGFNVERHVPDNHLLRNVDRFVDLFGGTGGIWSRTTARRAFLHDWEKTGLKGAMPPLSHAIDATTAAAYRR